MPLYTLLLEDHKTVFPVPLSQVQAAIQKLASPTGPTFLNIKDDGGNWAQAGGTSGRYRVEPLTQLFSKAVFHAGGNGRPHAALMISRPNLSSL